MYSVAQIAEFLQGQVIGDATLPITAMAPLESAVLGDVSFCAQAKFSKHLTQCQASVVLIHKRDLALVTGTAITVDNPYLAFAQLSQWFDWRTPVTAGIAKGACISDTAEIAASAQICHGAVIGEQSTVGENCYIGANTVIGDYCHIQQDTRIEPNVTLYQNVSVGKCCLIHAGAVIGGDGFGFAKKQDGWQKIHQLGGVVIGDDVEIGANTTIDRGALSDTVISSGVKLDNQVQIAHNVHLGENTAIAGCTAVAGSAKIGENCTIAGLVGITGHLEIAAGSHVTAMSLVSHSLKEPGVYSSGAAIDTHQNWKRNVVRFKSLDALAKKVKKIDSAVSALSLKEDKS